MAENLARASSTENLITIIIIKAVISILAHYIVVGTVEIKNKGSYFSTGPLRSSRHIKKAVVSILAYYVVVCTAKI